MNRNDAIAHAQDYFATGKLRDDFARRVAIPTESQNPQRGPELLAYLEQEMRPTLERLGFTCRILTHAAAKGPFLVAERIEDPAFVTVLGYGHGDVVPGQDADWQPGLSPWTVTERDGRWYGRGVVDNKGQHTINIAALQAVLETRGSLGFNVKYLIETGEEVGSPGLRLLAEEHRDLLRADLLIASDGPRLREDRPTLFLGARGQFTVDLSIDAREGAHHSGNWGGLLSNPALQLSHAIASIASPTGQIRIPEWVPAELPDSVRRVLADCEVGGGPEDPAIDAWWGEPGLTPAEQVFGWCSFEVLSFLTGQPDKPMNAVPPKAWARCQLRFVVGVDVNEIMPALRRHLDRQGFSMVKIAPTRAESTPATRLDPDDAWVRWTVDSITRTTGKNPTILPNLGGTLPNHVFTDTLGLRTIWIPHSYAGCSQHAPNEHVPVALVKEALELMTGLYWDLGEAGTPAV